MALKAAVAALVWTLCAAEGTSHDGHFGYGGQHGTSHDGHFGDYGQHGTPHYGHFGDDGQHGTPRDGHFGDDGQHGTPRDAHFGYEGQHGPDHWPALFPDCGGDHQSPVDIRPNETKTVTFTSPLIIPDYEWTPGQVRIWNNGHTVQLVPLDSESVLMTMLRGGPLTGEYSLTQLHFHWGKSDTEGSEHSIDGQFYSMEMHMVFGRIKETGEEKSDSAPDHTAVIAVFLKLSNRDNPSMMPIVEHLNRVVEVDSQMQMLTKVCTASLVPCLCSGFIFYNGSLTTPPCTEPVTWIVFRQPITVSRNQVAEFRRLKTPTGRMTTNRRPVQPMNDRDFYCCGPRRAPSCGLLLLAAALLPHPLTPL